MTSIQVALEGIHASLAMITGHAHLKLDGKEGEALSTGIVNVARHYPALAKSQKWVDWAMLMQTLAVVYGPRLYMSVQLARHGKPKGKPDATQPAFGE